MQALNIRYAFLFAGCIGLNVAYANCNPKDSCLQLDNSVSPIQTLPADNDIFDRTWDRIIRIWDTGDYEFLLPVNTWHNREMYDKSKTDSYNERPWGAGIGKSIREGDYKYSLVAMGFADSHKQFEPAFGYTFQRSWGLTDNNFLRVSLGMIVGVTMRKDYDYAPLPMPLPIFGIECGPLSIESTYIPGNYNNFNVLFTWVRWQF